MKPRRWWLSLVFFLPLIAFAGALRPAFAAEGGESNPAEEPLGTVFRWLNFALVAGAIGYLAVKYAPGWARRRADAIRTSLSEAAAAKAAADQELREAEEKLARLGQEIAELRTRAREESAAEAGRIRAHTREEIEKIERAGQAEIEATERAARLELKGAAARLAVERAGTLIRSQITARTQAVLFQSFLENLARSPN
jgi:F0F1-type ATP synthase membrane subunit b/b'